MKKKAISTLLITSLLLQYSLSFAQMQIPLTNSTDEDTENRECFSNMELTGIKSPSEYLDLQDQTASIINSELADMDEVKEIYRKNNCNPDAVNQLQNQNDNILNGISFRTKKQNQDDYKQACELEKDITDSEGCKPIRELSKAVKEGKFTAKEFHVLKNSKNYQYKNGMILLGAGGLVLTAVGLYIESIKTKISQETLDLEKQKYEDQKKANQPYNSTTQSNNEQKTEPKKEPVKAEPANTPTQPEPKIQITSTQLDPTTAVVPDVKIPENPIVEQDPEKDSEWENFNKGLKKQNDRCDLEKQAKKSGTSVNIIENQSITNFHADDKNIKKCSISKVKFELIQLENINRLCSDSECIKRKNARDAKNQREEKKLKVAQQQCAMHFGGTTQAEKNQCNEIQNRILNKIPGKSHLKIEGINDIIDSVKTKPSFESNPFQPNITGSNL